MNKLKELLSHGNGILEIAKEKYDSEYKISNDKLDAINVANTLMGEDDEATRLINKVASIKSYIDYINFIQKELNKIGNVVQTKTTGDYQYGCMYFGNGTLYFSDEFLKYNAAEAFDIVLNHIIHYTGCFYVVKSSEVRLSYILSAISTCYGDPVNYRDGRNIYAKHNKSFKHIIFDINESYSDFVIRNRKFMSFIKQYQNNENSIEQLVLVYRIVLSNEITLKNMRIKLESDNIQSVSETASAFTSENDLLFSLTA